MRQPPPRATLFPSTTLFRSIVMANPKVSLSRAVEFAQFSREAVPVVEQAEQMGQLIDFFPGQQLVDLPEIRRDRKSTRLNSSHANISYAGFCLKKKKKRSEL